MAILNQKVHWLNKDINTDLSAKIFMQFLPIVIKSFKNIYNYNHILGQEQDGIRNRERKKHKQAVIAAIFLAAITAILKVCKIAWKFNLSKAIKKIKGQLKPTNRQF